MSLHRIDDIVGRRDTFSFATNSDQFVFSIPPAGSLSCINDDTLGPIVNGCRDDFDFTIKFEQAFLSLVPSGIFIILALARFWRLLYKERVATAPKFQWLKLSVIAIFAGLKVRQLVLTSYGTSWTSQTAIASDALSFVVAVGLIPLSFLEHTRSPRPSILIGIYLLITILFDIAQSRTLWLSAESSYDEQLARLAVAAVVVKTVVLVLESHQKPKASYLDQKEQSPEVTSGMFKLATYSWLYRLFFKGYRKLLTMQDLYLLDESMSAEVLYAKFEPHMKKNVELGHKLPLARSLARTLAVPLLLPILPRLFRTGFLFCQPLLIESLLNYLQDPADYSPHKGFGYIGAAVFIYTGMAVSASTYYYLHERFLCMIRGILASAVYRHTTNLKLSAADDAAALTLMNADVERVKSGLMNLHEFWANTLEIAIGSWLLYRQIGAAFLAPILLVAVCAVVTTFNAGIMGRRQSVWMEAIQKRVGATSKVISNMKALKISAMSGPVESLINSLRLKELDLGGKWRTTLVAAITIAFIPSQLAPVVAFASTTENLGVTRIFTSMAYLMLVTGPLGMLFQSFPILSSAWACLTRIQTYLDKEVRVEFRKTEFIVNPAKQNGKMPSDAKATAISVRSGTFGWESGKNILKDINLDIPASSLTIIVGPIASGKSTLLKALLGETSFNSGDVFFGIGKRRIGYCDQSPFLYNNTIKANVIGHSPLDPERYSQVIEATMLSADLDTFPKRDRTKIGSKGATLSGGQKQRVALARALYLETDLLIFDDVLSGLDANTEEQVFRRVFGPEGLVRRRGATAILCTHSVRHLPSADHIVALGTDGTVVEQGSFATLKKNGKYIESLKIQEAKEAADELQEDADDNADANEPKSIALKRTATEDPNEEEMDKTRQKGDFAVYKHYFGTMSKLTIAAFFFWCCADSFTGAFPIVWLKYWSEDISASNPKHPKAYWLGIYALLCVSCLFSLMMVTLICLRTMIYESGAALHRNALRTLIGAPLRFFTVTDAGVTTNLFAQDITLIDGELPMMLINLVICFFNSVGSAAVITTSSPWLLVTYPFLVGICLVIQQFYLRTSRQIRLLDLEAKSPLYSHFTDTLNGLATIRALGFVSSDIAANNVLLDTSQRPAYQLALIQRWLSFTLRLLVAGIAVIVVTLATQLRSNSGFTGASLITIMYFGDNLTTVVQAYTHVETSIGAVARLRNFSATVVPESGPEEDFIPEKTWPENGTVDVKAVSASYAVSKSSPQTPDGKPASSTDLALRNLDLTIRSGEKIAVCGRTGSGKSSLVLLLLRLLEPLPDSNGEIVIDSLPFDKIDRDTLRRHIIAVSQDPIFLPDGSTIRANLDPFDEADEESCLEVLKQVNLDRAVEDKGGLDVELTAESLSAGQKQLFCLGRAVLRRRVRSSQGAAGGVLLLDEVSSSVDHATELEMHEVIQREFDGYTVVMVSHRLDTVTDCDTVVVMDKGRVAETGAPAVLIEKEGGLFKELWENSRRSKE